MERIVDIATDGRHLSALRGFLIVSEGRQEVGRVPLDDIAAVIVHAHGVTWTANLIVALAERGAPMVLCAANHAPVAVCLPLDGHHGQNARMRAQWEAGRPLAKQLYSVLRFGGITKNRKDASNQRVRAKKRSRLNALCSSARSSLPRSAGRRPCWPHAARRPAPSTC